MSALTTLKRPLGGRACGYFTTALHAHIAAGAGKPSPAVPGAAAVPGTAQLPLPWSASPRRLDVPPQAKPRSALRRCWPGSIAVTPRGSSESWPARCVHARPRRNPRWQLPLPPLERASQAPAASRPRRGRRRRRRRSLRWSAPVKSCGRTRLTTPGLSIGRRRGRGWIDRLTGTAAQTSGSGGRVGD